MNLVGLLLAVPRFQSSTPLADLVGLVIAGRGDIELLQRQLNREIDSHTGGDQRGATRCVRTAVSDGRESLLDVALSGVHSDSIRGAIVAGRKRAVNEKVDLLDRTVGGDVDAENHLAEGCDFGVRTGDDDSDW